LISEPSIEDEPYAEFMFYLSFV